LVMGGGQDKWVLPAETQGVFDALPGPKRLVMFPLAGHEMPFVHKDEGRWVEAVRAFLDSEGAL
jgi:pimeloyl-ACP methyl ester carboxylesterase